MTDLTPLFLVRPSLVQTNNVPHLHEVPKAPFTEDILEEPQVLLVVGVWVELRGEQGQSLMKPY